MLICDYKLDQLYVSLEEHKECIFVAMSTSFHVSECDCGRYHTLFIWNKGYETEMRRCSRSAALIHQ